MWSKPRVVVYTGLLISFAVAFLVLHGRENVSRMDNQPLVANSNLSLASQEFKDGEQIPAKYSCKGENINPPLNIAGVPTEAKSLVLVLHDPDAVGGDFVHWVMWGISVSTSVISDNSLPAGAIQGQNGAGQNKYMGPCPPAGTGTHHYVFELYALDKTLGLKAGASREKLQQAMNGHILGTSTLTGLFGVN